MFKSINMKIYSIIFLSFFIILNCQSKKDNLDNKFNGWTSHNLSGEVKEITIKSYTIGDLHTTRKLYGFYHRYKFSNSGDELVYNIYDENNAVQFESVPTYKNGKIIGTTIKNNQEKTLENWVIKKYLLGFYGGEMECYVDNKLVKKAINTINEKGHQTSMKVFSNDKLFYEQKLGYDKNENIIKTISNSYSNGTATVSESSFKYTKFDKNNNWTERQDNIDGKNLLTERSIIYY
jgi:hypothetical protein